jgi:aspartyl-tRNA(Asn)/glutamyl-tRNA(Gln) amidotransferase subunit A
LTTELTQLTAAEAREGLDRKQFSAAELCDAHLERIRRLDPQVKAFITVMDDVARDQAREADQRIARNDVAPMTGIPIALKDILCTTDAPTTAASQILRGFISPYDATVVQRLRSQGAVFVGKTNTDEFAMGSSTENSAFFPTRNPWDLGRVSGGSSGGSAAAVAADEAILSLGSDTGGSIRQPAGFCSIVGLKPTYGRVSRYGLMAFASSLDQIGPFARTVQDAAMLLTAISGNDPCDSTSMDIPVPNFADLLEGDIRGMKIGVPREYNVEGMDPAVEATVNTAVDDLRRLGAEIIPVSLPHTKYALATYYVIAPAEASSNLARYDGVKYGQSIPAGALLDSYLETRGKGFGAEVKRRIMLGTYALSAGYYDAYYVKAQKVRTLLKRDFDEVFATVDAVVAPTSPTVAFAIGERVTSPLQMYLADVFTIPANMAGLPALALPCGFAHGLPVSFQLMGKPFDEETILRIAHNYEQATGLRTKRPDLDAQVTGEYLHGRR